jgi:hypothetical protein
MPDPPELAYESVTPEQVIARLEILRERYRIGFFTPADFNATLQAFQFTDDIGHLWAPGATTSHWYRWDRDRWTQAQPPARLNVPQSPVLFRDLPGRVAPASPVEPAVARDTCPTCGTPNPGKKFCTACGTRLGVH